MTGPTFRCTLCGATFSSDPFSLKSCGCPQSKLAKAEELESYAKDRADIITELRSSIAHNEIERAKLIRRARDLRREVDPNYDRPIDEVCDGEISR